MVLQKHILWGIGLTGLMGIGALGSGVSAAQLNFTPTYHVSGTIHASGASRSPSPASSTHKPGHSRGVPSLKSSTSFPYNPVVTEALNWAKARTKMSLGAPTWLPSLPKTVGAYLSATATATAGGWSVALHGTAKPYGINNPAIAQAASTHPWVSFSTQTLTTSQETASPLSLLEAYSQMGPSHPTITTGTAHQVALGDGITGSWYSNGTLLWHEGDWTLVVSGSHDLATAKPMVAYLHQAYLPPHPGLVAVFQNRASIDWLQGRHLLSIQGGPVPALDVLHMAVTWRPRSS